MKFFLKPQCALVLMLVMLSACSTQQGRVERSPGQGQGESPIDSTTPPLLPPAAPTAPAAPIPVPPARNYPRNLQDSGASPAAISLVRQAQDARSSGQTDQALALIERALRIEPRNPFIWQALASTQMDLKAWDQAESAAAKSNSCARGNPYADLTNWKIIAAARQAAGDSPGALTAQARASDIAARIATP
jgi:tetratricopeptide (TPR) repeat protein